MEQSIWSRFTDFVQQSFTQKFKAFMPGVFMGFIGSKSILWDGEVGTVVIYILKAILTIIMAFGSGLATSYAALIVENHKNKKNGNQQKGRKRKKTA